MGKNKWNVALFIIGTIAIFFPGIGSAESFNFTRAPEVQRFFDGASGFLVTTVGSGVFLIGLITSGIKISSGDQGGLKTTVMVMVGGVIIFLAKPIVEMLTKLAGN